MLDLLLNLSSGILALTGLISVSLTNQLNPLIYLPGLVFISIALFTSFFNIKLRISKLIWNFIVIFAFLFMMVDLFLKETDTKPRDEEEN